MGSWKWLIVVPVAAATAALTMPAIAATAQSALMSLNAEAALGSNLMNDPETVVWEQALSALTVASSATVGNDAGNVLQAYGTGSATWADPNDGTVVFTNYGWSLSGPSTSFFLSLELEMHDWQYSFETGSGENALTVHYSTAGTGSTFGLPGWEITVIGGPQGVQVAGLVQGPSIPTGSGTFVASLTPGSQYTIYLQNRANLAGSGLPFAGSMSGEFDWQISSVPESPVAPLFATGLMLLGWRRCRGALSARGRQSSMAALI